MSASFYAVCNCLRVKLQWSDLPDGAEECSLQRLSKESFSDLLHGQSLDHLFEARRIRRREKMALA